MTGWQTQPDKIEPGFYQTRWNYRTGTGSLERTPWQPVRIYRAGLTLTGNDELEWRAEISGEPFRGSIFDLWIRCCGHPIDEKEYNFLLARIRHARKWEPESPYANPNEPVDWLTVKLPKGPKAR